MAQISRLIVGWRERVVIQPQASQRHSFPTRYTPDDIVLLAKVDAAHEGLSGPAVRRILQRDYEVYGQADYKRLAFDGEPAVSPRFSRAKRGKHGTVPAPVRHGGKQ